MPLSSPKFLSSPAALPTAILKKVLWNKSIKPCSFGLKQPESSETRSRSPKVHV